MCLTLCDPMDCSPPGSFVHGILQAETCSNTSPGDFVKMQILIQEVLGGPQDCMSCKPPGNATSAGTQLHYSGKEARIQAIVFPFLWYFPSEATAKQQHTASSFLGFSLFLLCENEVFLTWPQFSPSPRKLTHRHMKCSCLELCWGKR